MRNCFQFIPIYRTPRSKVNGLTMSGFLEEIELFLDEICVTPHKLLLVGDFNIHMDIPTDSDTKKFNEILANTGLCQSVVGPTHKAGHTLDLLISRDSDDHLIQAVAVDPLFHSDHNIVTCTVQCAKPPPLKVTTTSHEYGKMDHERLTSLLKDRLAELPLDEDPNALVESYETITSSVLDEVCPLVTKTRTVKPKLPWYNQTIHEERRIRRRLERRWKKTRTESDETAFIAQKDYVTRLITNAKIDYFTNKCNSSTPKTMYNTINVLLNKNSSTLPDCVSYKDLADQFLSFFIEKVEKIRDNVSSVHAHGTVDKTSSVLDENVCMSGLFKPLSTDDVQKIIMKMPTNHVRWIHYHCGWLRIRKIYQPCCL